MTDCRLLLTLLLLSTAAFGQSDWKSSAPFDGDWSDSANWTNDVPDASSHVDINTKNDSHFARIRRMPEYARAACVQVGVGRGEFGQLRIIQHGLRLNKRSGDSQSGILYLGRSRGTGDAYVRNSDLTVERRIVVAGGTGTRGSLRLDAGARVDCGELRIGTKKSKSASIALRGDALVETGLMEMSSRGTQQIEITAQSELGRIRTNEAPELHGELRIDLTDLSQAFAPEIVLIDNQSTDPIRGGFQHVNIVNPDEGRYYELTYAGGDGNDLSLIGRTKPVSRYERWASVHFGSDDGLKTPMSDPDRDGLTNIVEYALGRSPTQDEGVWMRGQTTQRNDKIETRAWYTQRSDRKDVRLFVQGRVSGGHWRSDYFKLYKLDTDGRSTEMRANASTPETLNVRMFAELKPDAAEMNVLFVIADDLNDWVECLNGHNRSKTPNINRLASRGLLFREAHASATICGPSRVSLLTGIPPAISGVYRNPQELRESAISNAETLPGYYKSLGYDTVGSGKIFHDVDPQSWDDYWPSFTKYRPDDPSVANKPLNGITSRKNNFDWGPIDAPAEEMSDYKVASYVGNQLHLFEEDSPFFLGCGFFRPHLPFFAPQKYFDRINTNGNIVPESSPIGITALPGKAREIINFEDDEAVMDANQQTNAIHSYLASVTFMDEQVGRLLDALDSSPHGRNTIVVFVSDHGWLFGEKKHWRKQVLWDSCTHVPMIIVAPGMSTPGTVCDSPVSLLDVFPTLVDLCGLPTLGQLQGNSLVPLLKNPKKSTPPVITTRLRKQHSVNTQRYHLIQYQNGSRELYDRWNDPNEWWNLASDSSYNGVINSLKKWVPND